jgi:hypothetical protein
MGDMGIGFTFLVGNFNNYLGDVVIDVSIMGFKVLKWKLVGSNRQH